MDHNDDMDSEERAMWTAVLVDFVRVRCGAAEDYSAEDLLRARGIMQTNGVNQGVAAGTGLYPTFSFLSHK